MRKFVANMTDDWSSQMIKTTCPWCTQIMSFYSQLRNNQCNSCKGVLPFPSRMAKNIQLRVEYHVSSKAEK